MVRGPRTTMRSGPRLPQLEEALARSEEHTSELQSHSDLVCRLLLEKKRQPIDANMEMTEM